MFEDSSKENGTSNMLRREMLSRVHSYNAIDICRKCDPQIHKNVKNTKNTQTRNIQKIGGTQNQLSPPFLLYFSGFKKRKKIFLLYFPLHLEVDIWNVILYHKIP